MTKLICLMRTLAVLLFIGSGAAILAAPPVNDNYEDALVTTLSQSVTEFQSTNFFATKQTDEPDHARNIGGKSVWFKVVPQQDTVLSIYIDTTSGGENLDTLLAVYKGSFPTELNKIAENDDAGLGLLSRVDIFATAGTAYLVAVDGRNQGGNVAQGNFRIRFEKTAAPRNDEVLLDSAVRLSDTRHGFIAGTNVNATKGPGEADITANPGGKSVWYIWRAPFSQTTSVALGCNGLTGGCFDMQLGVFAATGGVRVAANDDYEGTNQRSKVTFFAEAGEFYAFAVDGIKNAGGTVASGTFFLDFYQAEYRYDSNFDGADGKADLTVFRPESGVWYSLRSADHQAYSVPFGQPGDTPAPADYDGDGLTDPAVVRNTPEGKFWYILRSKDNQLSVIHWGVGDDRPLVGDYDGDGRADLVVVRQTAQGLVWYLRDSTSPNTMSIYYYGLNTDQPVTGNFLTGLDSAIGLTTADIAVVRNENGKKVWYLRSRDGLNTKQIQFGLASDVNVPFDYDNDGFADIAVWRPSNGTWYILKSATGALFVKQWGLAGDIPQPGNFGIGEGDLAVFRPASGTWWISYKGSDIHSAVQFGTAGDRPAASATSLMNP
jgi:hypothetical protein